MSIFELHNSVGYFILLLGFIIFNILYAGSIFQATALLFLSGGSKMQHT